MSNKNVVAEIKKFVDIPITDRTLNNGSVYEKTGGNQFLFVGNTGSWAISK